MSVFTLAIFCLTIFNLLWFMDLTFQLHMQYCSLQHRTLLPSPVTSTTECCFCFGSVYSFFVESFLHSSTKPCVHQDPGERSSDPRRDRPRLACECPGVSGGGAGRWCTAAGSGAMSAAVRSQDLLKVFFITSTIAWSQAKQQRGITAPPINRKLN